MADEADVANEYEDMRRESLIKSITQKKPIGPSLSECAECGDDIPEGRRAAVPGVKHCLACAQLIDLKANGVRRV